MEERIMKKTIGGLLMWCGLISICLCSPLSLITGGVLLWAGYVLIVRNMTKDELNEEV